MEGEKSLILMDACIGCDKISPIYHFNVPDFTFFINSSLSCAAGVSWCDNRICSHFCWVVNSYYRQEHKSRVPPTTRTSHFQHSPLQRCAAALRPCDGLSGASVKWQSFALRFLTRHLSSSSSRCRQFQNTHCALLSVSPSPPPLKNHEYFAIVFGRHKLGRSCFPSTAVWMWKRSRRTRFLYPGLFCTPLKHTLQKYICCRKESATSFPPSICTLCFWRLLLRRRGRSVYIPAIQRSVWIKQIRIFVKAVKVKDSEAVFLAPEVWFIPVVGGILTIAERLKSSRTKRHSGPPHESMTFILPHASFSS